ncbi:MAG: 50S ribosomal protein L29 [Candidatus Kerfeldbacteria bacterium]|nr:50S ribosomal protein L29 [Candidatus Kerfeldbacteria bacterium]
MNMHDLKNKTRQELEQLLKDARQELQELRFKTVNAQLKDVHRIRVVRTTIARIQTVLQQQAATTQASSAIQPSTNS